MWGTEIYQNFLWKYIRTFNRNISELSIEIYQNFQWKYSLNSVDAGRTNDDDVIFSQLRNSGDNMEELSHILGQRVQRRQLPRKLATLHFVHTFCTKLHFLHKTVHNTSHCAQHCSQSVHSHIEWRGGDGSCPRNLAQTGGNTAAACTLHFVLMHFVRFCNVWTLVCTVCCMFKIHCALYVCTVGNVDANWWHCTLCFEHFCILCILHFGNLHTFPLCAFCISAICTLCIWGIFISAMCTPLCCLDLNESIKLQHLCLQCFWY